MKCLIVLSALVALSAGGLVAPFAYSGLGYSSLPYAAYPYGLNAPLYNSLVAPAFKTVLSAPAVVAAPAVVSAPAVLSAPAVFKSQYHAQDELGQASYGHSEPLQTHTAVQDAAGNKVGSFSYVAPTGEVLRTDYVADALGYRVNSNALPIGPGPAPVAVADTPEVVAARAAHLAAHARARRDVIAVGHTPAATAPLFSAPLVAPYAYSAPIVAPYAYSAPIVAHSAPIVHAPVAAPALVREATLTTVVNNPGHAVSYRVD